MNKQIKAIEELTGYYLNKSWFGKERIVFEKPNQFTKCFSLFEIEKVRYGFLYKKEKFEISFGDEPYARHGCYSSPTDFKTINMKTKILKYWRINNDCSNR